MALVPAPSRADLIERRSPISADDYAEYPDGTSFELFGQERFKANVTDFWPSKGSQWGVLDAGLRF
jgi:hypothetical protein